MIGRGVLCSPGGAGSTRSSQSAIGQRHWSFHVVRGGVDQGDSRFHPWSVGAAVIRRDI